MLKYITILIAGLLTGCVTTNTTNTRPYNQNQQYNQNSYNHNQRILGIVENVNVVTKDQSSINGGAVVGALVGGILGNQIGRGSGKTAATIAGAAAGGYVGNQMAKEPPIELLEIQLFIQNTGERTVVYANRNYNVRIGDRIPLSRDSSGRYIIN